MVQTKKRFSPPQLAEGSWDYFPEIRELCELRFGSGYVDEEEFSKWMEHPELLQIALVDGKLAGVAVLLPASAQVIAEKMKMTEEEVLQITAGRPALIYKCAALWPWYEKQGINHVVAADGLRRAREMGCGAIFSAAWMYNGTTPARGVFGDLGFTPLYRRKMLWYHDEKYKCVVCGGRCTCDAMIYYKKLEGDDLGTKRVGTEP